MGSGTTMLAAMCAGRSSLGYEVDDKLQPIFLGKIAAVPDIAQRLIDDRLAAHHEFIKERMASKGDLKYINHHYGFAVMTRQEQDLCLDRVKNIQYLSGNRFTVGYVNPASVSDAGHSSTPEDSPSIESPHRPSKGRQLKLF